MKTIVAWALVLTTPVMAAMPAEEWHEYCEMTVHVTVDGWEALKEEQVVSIPINKDTLKCHHEFYTDYVGTRHTIARADLTKTALAPLKTSLNQTNASVHIFHADGEVGDVNACERVTEILERSALAGGKLKAKVTRKIVRQDWTSSKNTDVSTIEELKIALDGNSDIPFHAGQSIQTRGKYCSKKPAGA